MSISDLSDDDDLEDEGGPKKSKGQELLSSLQSQLPFLAKLMPKKSPKAEVEKTSKNDAEEEQEKPKKKLKVIHIVIIIGLALLVLHEDEETKEQPKKDQGTAKVVPKYKRKKVAVPVEQPKIEEPTEVETEPDPVVVPTPTEPTVAQPEQPLDNTFESDAPTTTTDDSETVSDVEDQLDSLFEEDNIVAGEDNRPEPVQEPKVEEPTSLDTTDDLPYEVSLPTQPEVDESSDELLTFDDEIVNQVIESEGEEGDGITTSILQELEKEAKKKKTQIINNKKLVPTNAPSYLTVGRGLVYNCVGKHWACVDSTSFKECGDNYAWRLKNSDPVQCYPNEYYDSNMDCASMQQYKIDMAAETDFCK